MPLISDFLYSKKGQVHKFINT
jgi:hypothetical protein